MGSYLTFGMHDKYPTIQPMFESLLKVCFFTTVEIEVITIYEGSLSLVQVLVLLWPQCGHKLDCLLEKIHLAMAVTTDYPTCKDEDIILMCDIVC